jgi:hypothetical protein
MIDDGHRLANHMCKHDIMATSHYRDAYGAEMKQEAGCLVTEAQKAKFHSMVQGTIDLYYAMCKANGYNLPADAFKIIRFPGDGRFMNCLIKAVMNPNFGISVGALKHLGWTYEFAPLGTFGHVKDVTGVEGLAGALPRNPKNGDIVLAHDLHYAKGRVNLLVSWVKLMLSRGFTFGLPNIATGVCEPV